MCLHLCTSIFERLRRPRESQRDYPCRRAYKCLILEILCYLPAENNKTVKKGELRCLTGRLQREEGKGERNNQRQEKHRFFHNRIWQFAELQVPSHGYTLWPK